MNIVLIIPTGVGAEIGGHAGDANPVCKLLASIADVLITHPNVVNASDINEMPDNVWYVEGSILDQFLHGVAGLRQPLQNKIAVLANAPVRADTINAVSAARATIGIDATIHELKVPLRMAARMEGGIATGDVYGWEELVAQVEDIPWPSDAVAIHTPIEVSREVALSYYRNGGVNPWGGVEAKASNLIAARLNKPVAHAPLENVTTDDPELLGLHIEEVVDPRIAPEAVSVCYLHCVLKGLHRAPRIDARGMSVADIDAAVFPHGCAGVAHHACLSHGIPVIEVAENRTVCNSPSLPDLIEVANYWEAAGVLQCMKAGVSRQSVRRPLAGTHVIKPEGANE